MGKRGQVRPYWPQLLAVFGDAALVSLAVYVSYLIRFDFEVEMRYGEEMLRLLPVFVLLRVVCLYSFGAYSVVWRYTSINDLVRILKGVVAGSALLGAASYMGNYPLTLLLAIGAFASAAMKHFGESRMVAARRVAVGLALVLSPVVIGGAAVAVVVFSVDPAAVGESLGVGEDSGDDVVTPRAVLVLEGILSFALIGGVRVAPRIVAEGGVRSRRQGRRVLVYGVDEVSVSLVRSLRRQGRSGYSVVGFVEEDPQYDRRTLDGVPVLGGREQLGEIIAEHRVEEVLIASMDPPGQVLQSLATGCRRSGAVLRYAPSLSAILEGRLDAGGFQEIQTEDLLGRTQIDLDSGGKGGYLRDRVVLVTGAGGSIGSELCRQISQCAPGRLLLLGKGENSIYRIQQELESSHPEQERVGIIGDVVDREKMMDVVGAYRPDVIFHAAAHKHVPFMEHYPEEAVRNNVLGTLAVGEVAAECGVGKFVLISSDKAVKPSSVMGVSKRVAEMVVQDLARRETTAFMSVRFGNVLRSRGSVVPLFEKQIEAGGPVTVTDPEMTRYFMSIAEAARLVLHSGSVAENGDLCVLDMGEPVRIVELAENMIRMAGKRPHEDIEIVISGIRPGEKLHEELFTEGEAASVRRIDKIMLCQPEAYDAGELERGLEVMREGLRECDRRGIVAALGEVVPEFGERYRGEWVAEG